MSAELLRYIDRLFARHTRKLRNVFARGVVTLVQDGFKMQGLQLSVLPGELIDGAEHPQPYGFSSHPLEGAEAFVAFAGSDHTHPVVLVVDDRRYRIVSSAPGEVVIYTDEGDKVHLRRGRKIEVTTMQLEVNAEASATYNTANFTVNASGAATINAASLLISAGAIGFAGKDGADVEAVVQGKLRATDDVISETVSGKGHVHGGVTPGTYNTGGPS